MMLKANKLVLSSKASCAKQLPHLAAPRLSCRRCTCQECRRGVSTSAALKEPAAEHVEKQRSLLSKRTAMAVMSPKAALTEMTYEVGPLGPNDVDIRVTHNGLCHTDMHMRDDDWGISAFPFVPGHEVVGVVAQLGDSVKGLKVGERVGVSWIADSCRTCPACIRGDENLCENGYTGLCVMGGKGGFQDVMRVPADFAFKLPDGLASADAAPLLCAGVTVYGPIKRITSRRPGSHVAVLGIGGLGHLALQFAYHLGAEVTALGHTLSKEAEAKGFGASRYLNLEQAKASKLKFDLIINCSSSSVSAAELMTMLANDGSLVQVGIPGGNAQITIGLQDLVFGQKRLEGSIVGGRRDMVEMLHFSGLKGIKPMIECMPLSKVNEAMQKVLNNTVRYRVVLTSE